MVTPLLGLLLVVGTDWQPWSVETLGRARHDQQLIFVVVTRGDGPAVLGDEAVAAALARFVAVRVDRDERPDLADVARLARTLSSDADPPPPSTPLWMLLTAALHPVSAGVLEALSPGALAALLSAVADGYKQHPAEVEMRAGIAAARLVAAQAPEPPQGPLERAIVERALGGVGEASGAPSPGRLRLLLAEFSRAPTARNRDALDHAFATLVQSPAPSDIAGQALRLRSLAEGFAATGSTPLREAAWAMASRLAGSPRNSDGAFIGQGKAPRALAFENGLAIGALAVSSTVLGRVGDRDMATKAAAAITAGPGPWPSLARCAGPAGRCGGAYLEDYAFLAEALLDLLDATGDLRWRDEARRAIDAAIGRFLDVSAGGFFDTDAAHVPLPARLKNGYDGERPSANGVMAAVLVRLARATGEKRYEELSRSSVEAFRGDLQRSPSGMETMVASVVPLAIVPAHVASEAPHAAREARGPVTIEASLDPAQVPSGSAITARVHLAIAPPWTVNGHRPSAGDLIPLTVSVPGDRFVVGAATYPRDSTCVGSVTIEVPLRVRSAVPPGPTTVRFTVRFQRCRGAECQAPESVILEAPLVVEAVGR
jgi:uncharacterized protein YyaL (SSP411 family)